VDVSGAVVPSSVVVIRTTNEQLVEPARRVLVEAEFNPGLIDGRAVPVLMEHAVSVAAEP